MSYRDQLRSAKETELQAQVHELEKEIRRLRGIILDVPPLLVEWRMVLSYPRVPQGMTLRDFEWYRAITTEQGRYGEPGCTIPTNEQYAGKK